MCVCVCVCVCVSLFSMILLCIVILNNKHSGICNFLLLVKEKLMVEKDSEIAATSLRLSLICPVSLKELVVIPYT